MPDCNASDELPRIRSGRNSRAGRGLGEGGSERGTRSREHADHPLDRGGCRRVSDRRVPRMVEEGVAQPRRRLRKESTRGEYSRMGTRGPAWFGEVAPVCSSSTTTSVPTTAPRSRGGREQWIRRSRPSRVLPRIRERPERPRRSMQTCARIQLYRKNQKNDRKIPLLSGWWSCGLPCATFHMAPPRGLSELNFGDGNGAHQALSCMET